MADGPSRRACDEIRSAVAGGHAVLFCGAGISIDPPSTLPDWKTFRDQTIKAVASAESSLAKHLPALLEQEVIGGIGEALAPELVASQVRAVVPDYFQSLRALDHDYPNGNHATIARLAHKGLLSLVVTTNFDQLIEKALVRATTDMRVYRSDDDFAGFDADDHRAGTIGVLKLHGCLSEPDTIVATVEQEAVGLSAQKAAVLRELVREYVLLFWGYSGADLKLSLDYLQMVTAMESSPGFFWNLYATPTWREPPNQYIAELVDLYAGRGVVCHEDLSQALRPLIGTDAEPSWPAPPLEDASELRTRRTDQLNRALESWAQRSVRPAHAFEIFGRLFERTAALPSALTCYQQLGDLGQTERKPALVALGYTRGGDLLSRMGQLAEAEEALRLADDRARTAGALDLDLMAARTQARLFAMQGRVLPAVQPLGFGRLLSQWASPSVAAGTLGLELDTADHLLAQGLIDSAMGIFRAAERDARDGGRLETVADALERRSRAHARRGEWSDAITCAREARDIAFALGLASDVRLLELRLVELDEGAGGPNHVSEASLVLDDADRARNQRLSSELILNTLESDQVDPERALVWLSRVASYVDGGGRDLAVRLAVARSRAYEALGRAEDEIDAITAVLAQLGRAGSEQYAVELYHRLAQLQIQSGRGKDEVLRNLESAAHISRRSLGLSPAIEDALAELRGAARFPESWPSFIARWSESVEDLPEVLQVLAASAGVEGGLDLGAELEARLGSAGRFTWCLWSSAVLCRQLRLDGRVENALELARGCLPVADDLGDSQLTAVFHNESGLNLMRLDRTDEALGEFERAVTASEACEDKVELIDDLFNAAGACERLDRPDQAIELYRRMQVEVISRQDLIAALDVSLRSGEVLKAVGRDDEALGHFESAEYCARALGDARKVEQIVLRLGKLYWNVGAFEHSIRYRLEAMGDQERKGAPAGVARFAVLVASTFDERLGRPHDAMPFYRHALSLADSTPTQLNPDVLRQLLASCEQRAQAFRDKPSLYQVLIDAAGSEAAAAHVASRMALSVDYNLWRFELRSFAAWYERTFSAGALVTTPPSHGDEFGPAPDWPLFAVSGLTDLGRAARELHDHEQAQALFGVADAVAAASLSPQARDMVDRARAAEQAT